MINWSTVRTIEDLAYIDPKLLYDDTRVYTPSELLQLNPTLSDSEIEDALFWARFRRGVMLITGQVRQGKSTLEHLIAKKLNYYFRMIPILDTRPRSIFGKYIPFSSEMLEEQIKRMDSMEKSEGETTEDGRWIAHMTKEETTGKGKNKETITTEYNGEIFLRNAVIGMDEFGSKYMNRRDAPNLPIKRELLKIFNYWGHSNCLWIGVGIDIEDIDRRCLDKIVWEARCSRIWDADECEKDRDAIIIGVWLSPVRYNPMNDRVELAGEPEALRINASKPQSCLGGQKWCDIFKTDNVQGFALPKRRKEQ